LYTWARTSSYPSDVRASASSFSIALCAAADLIGASRQIAVGDEQALLFLILVGSVAVGSYRRALDLQKS